MKTRRILGSLVLLVALLGGGCGNRQAGRGAGTTVDFCVGYFFLLETPEPVPDDATDMVDYANTAIRIIDRIKLSFRVKLAKGPPLVIPPSVGSDLKIVRSGMTRLRDDVKAAQGDRAKVRAADNRLMFDDSVSEASNRIGDFATKCPN